jgi:hypothetical protein
MFHDKKKKIFWRIYCCRDKIKISHSKNEKNEKLFRVTFFMSFYIKIYCWGLCVVNWWKVNDVHIMSEKINVLLLREGTLKYILLGNWIKIGWAWGGGMEIAGFFFEKNWQFGKGKFWQFEKRAFNNPILKRKILYDPFSFPLIQYFIVRILDRNVPF